MSDNSVIYFALAFAIVCMCLDDYELVNHLQTSMARRAGTIDQNSFLHCFQLNAPCTRLWRVDHQERMRYCFELFLSTTVMCVDICVWGRRGGYALGYEYSAICTD